MARALAPYTRLCISNSPLIDTPFEPRITHLVVTEVGCASVQYFDVL